MVKNNPRKCEKGLRNKETIFGIVLFIEQSERVGQIWPPDSFSAILVFENIFEKILIFENIAKKFIWIEFIFYPCLTNRVFQDWSFLFCNCKSSGRKPSDFWKKFLIIEFKILQAKKHTLIFQTKHCGGPAERLFPMRGKDTLLGYHERFC